MNANEIRELCIKSAEKYYEYLEQNGKGIDEIKVTHKTKSSTSDKLWELKLGGRIFNLDAIKIFNKRNQKCYNDKDFIVESYDVETNRLVIEFKNENETFNCVDAKHLLIISDLKFLVENVKNWFLNNGNSLELPITDITNDINYDKKKKNKTNVNKPDACQCKAIGTVLKNKLTYIWGPPGTGKTREVLKSSVFNYIDNPDNLIAVFAPTNNALDEVMTALLENADKCNIPRQNFFRIGVPSKEFAAKYPEVCESKELNKSLQQFKAQSQIIKEVANYRRGENTLKSVNLLLPLFNDIQIDLSKRDDLLLAYSKIGLAIEQLKIKNGSFVSTIKRIVTSKKPKEQLLLDEYLKKQNNLNKEIEIAEKQIEIALTKIKRVHTESPKIDNELNSLNFQNLKGIKTNIETIKLNIQKYLNKLEFDIKEYKTLSSDQLAERKTEIEKKIEFLETQGIDERIKNCVVLGMTLDTFIGRFMDKNIKFNHIFLDEVAYVPLIKALVLYRNSTPLTFLGDHKQLPPICEMNEIELNKPQNRKVILWEKSALFCETMFSSSWRNLLNKVLLSDIPRFKYTYTSELKKTYRFGSNLAKILDDLFYQFEFCSADNKDTNKVKLYLIDALLQNQTSRRENIAECEAIKIILNTHLSDSDSDYAILTPYLDQVALLNLHIPEIRRKNKALTIAKSQGREWDTVIISVVDCKNTKQPWFTDTTNKKSKGAHVMNTAVSRVRKNLYLVCDKDYWQNRQDRDKQLISKMIEACVEIKL